MRKMTAARKRALRKAQLASARKRKGRSKDTLGHWVAKGVRRTASMATMGMSTALVEFMEGAARDKKRKQAARTKRKKR